MAIVASGPLLPLEAPLPEPRQYELLDTVRVREQENDRWLGGAWTGGYVPGPAFTHDPCSTGTDRVKQPAGRIGDQTARRFTVYLPAFCTTVSIHNELDEWLTKLRRAFEIYESAGVERILATGDGHGSDIGSFLCDENLEILNAGDSADPVVAYGLLEQAAARHGGGVIHIGIRTFATWYAARLAIPNDGVMRTPLGTPISVGYGYAGATPVNGSPADDTEEWAFASGALELYRLDEILITPPSEVEALDRSMNDVFFLAERPYLINWLGRTDPGDDDHVQAGVLVAVGSGCCISGGGP